MRFMTSNSSSNLSKEPGSRLNLLIPLSFLRCVANVVSIWMVLEASSPPFNFSVSDAYWRRSRTCFSFSGLSLRNMCPGCFHYAFFNFVSPFSSCHVLPSQTRVFASLYCVPFSIKKISYKNKIRKQKGRYCFLLQG